MIYSVLAAFQTLLRGAFWWVCLRSRRQQRSFSFENTAAAVIRPDRQIEGEIPMGTTSPLNDKQIEVESTQLSRISTRI